jgi:50S ribosomal protein L16 3-hydroxylase
VPEHTAGQLPGGFSARRFLREYWQRKPLLLRGAVSGLADLLPADELAGLALEPEVESRIVLEKGRKPWELRRGPFTEDDFARLPKSRWTLLVQAVDQWLPEAADVRAQFGFLPGWRFDDIMVSYATDGGGVGPHFDYYDVFLIQASGRRRWRIGQHCDADTPLRSDAELRILQRFDTQEEFVLEPGDMLYVPPGVGHWGIAEGDCMTWSVGFRAPSHAEIVQEIAAQVAEQIPEHRRFGDAGRSYPADGRIPAHAIAEVRRALDALRGADDALLADWLGRYMSARKYPELEIAPRRAPAGGVRAIVSAGRGVERHPASRFAWVEGDPASLYVDGECLPCPAALAALLCSGAVLDAAALRPWLRARASRLVLDTLLVRGALQRV